MKCSYCGKEITCYKHGGKHIKEDIDLAGYPFYYCMKCIEQNHMIYIIHYHSINVISDLLKSFYKLVKEMPKSETDKLIEKIIEEIIEKVMRKIKTGKLEDIHSSKARIVEKNEQREG